MVDPTTQPGSTDKLATLEAMALERVYTGTEWLSADEIGALGGHGQANPGEAAIRWKTTKELFAIRREDKDLFPRYTLSDSFTPLPAVKDVLKVLNNWDALAIAVWFESTSSFFAGKRPRELISLNGDLVVKAAQDAVARLND